MYSFIIISILACGKITKTITQATATFYDVYHASQYTARLLFIIESGMSRKHYCLN